ncbi:MAG: ATP-dependent DNA helicase RecG [Elusimicrobiota bacterium]
MKLNKNVRYLKGVGKVRAGQLKKLGINTVKELLTYFPKSYEDRRAVKEMALINDGEKCLVKGEVISSRRISLRGRGKTLIKIGLKDSSGKVTLLGFNRSYLKNVFIDGESFYVYGKFKRKTTGLEITSFTYEKASKKNYIHLNRITPVYGLTTGISQKWMRRLIYNTVHSTDWKFSDVLPRKIARKNKFYSINTSVKKLHCPDNFKDIKVSQHRLILEEFLIFQTALAVKKMDMKKDKKNRTYQLKKNFLTPFKNKLDFEFTGDQKRVINEIFKDMLSDYPMKRLLQGEVGSGKTVVALSALLLAVENGYLGVVIAPTEILAEQHYLTFKSYLTDLGVNIALLKGGMKKKNRKRIIRDLKDGSIDIIVGTHALLEEDVQLSRAGIAVIDEQHRFGVQQKADLVAKSKKLDVLAMSATPIPRSLAICNYGDLDISTIRELPEDRKTPRTEHLNEGRAYQKAVRELEKGNRVYIVHPLIEDSDKNELKSARKRFEKLKETVFKDYSCGLLHGRMKSSRKENIMKEFSRGNCEVLFTTTVIEVGIDVPRATVMIIENFNRYGLSTLHQLRGRIARSNKQPYCLLTGDTTTEESERRLEIILSSHDGFKIAEEDLKLRGAGELFGTRQHGEMDFKIGNPVEDFEILKQARKYAFAIVDNDPRLAQKSNRNLKKAVLKKYSDKFHLADIS